MKEVVVQRRELDPRAYRGKIPQRSEYKTLITEDVVFVENGKPVIIYKILPKKQLETLRRIMNTSTYLKSKRTRGLPTQSAIYGALPRVPHRNNRCRLSANTMNQPANAKAVFDFADYLSRVYQSLLPEQFEMNLKIVEESVESEYILHKTPFTTVNFNLNHAIKYHTDTGNFKNVYSNVLILKDGIQGGFLVAPEFDVAFAQQDGALILFDGQNIIHGVTPIKALHPGAYRCSCVFYSLETMRNCYPFKQELDHANSYRDRVESEFRRKPDQFGSLKKDYDSQTLQTEK